MNAVDSHAHVFSANAPAVAGARYRPAYAATLVHWQSLWRTAGITHGVLVQPSFFGTDNAELLAALAIDPQRLRGVAVIAPGADDALIARLHAGGVRGIRWNQRGVADLSSLASPGWKETLARIAERGWHLEAFVEPGALPVVIDALEGTTIDVVFDHFGNPGATPRAIADTFESARRFCAGYRRRVHVKLSGAYRLGGPDPRELARRWLEIGARALWGSDWPWTQHEAGRDYARLRADLDRWLMGASTTGVLWDNPARLYHFD